MLHNFCYDIYETYLIVAKGTNSHVQSQMYDVPKEQ